ncbi:MAG: GNAT family N-acetyltransferase [Candidatus Thermoplasmatota archaeon]|jgi:GNAT superfamily N-acetyltransferase|nr:GNAT family N-acetyltransferase [Candidatus Thermoplasmatota archaeon]
MEGMNDLSIGDLDSKSWPKFEAFFNKYDGVQNSCWCVYYHERSHTLRSEKAKKGIYNHDLKKKLVEEGRSRSVLIYRGGRVIASCQYGTFEELPRIENAARYVNLGTESGNERKWRITCFFVDTQHRHKGVAKLALDGVLERIARYGGGIVEAYPVKEKGNYEVWFGSVHMFIEKGFQVIADFGKSNVLVRKNIEPIRV